MVAFAEPHTLSNSFNPTLKYLDYNLDNKVRLGSGRILAEPETYLLTPYLCQCV